MSHGYEDARAAFDRIAAHSGPLDGLLRMRAAQVTLARAHVRRWENHGGDLEQVALLCEEVGELEELVWLEVWSLKDADRVELEVQDILNVAATLATSHRLDFATVVDVVYGLGVQDECSIPVAAGLVARTVVKARHKLRGLGDRDTVRRSMYGALVLLVLALHQRVRRQLADRDLRDIFVAGVERIVARWSGEMNA
jgi:hypothetical protein